MVENAYAARFLASGHLVYAQGGRLMSAPFDAGNLRVTGPASAVLESVRIDPLSPPDLGVSYDGLIAFVPGRMFTPEYRLVLADRSGAITELPDIKETYVQSPAFSPDGGRVTTWRLMDAVSQWCVRPPQSRRPHSSKCA